MACCIRSPACCRRFSIFLGCTDLFTPLQYNPGAGYEKLTNPYRKVEGDFGQARTELDLLRRRLQAEVLAINAVGRPRPATLTDEAVKDVCGISGELPGRAPGNETKFVRGSTERMVKLPSRAPE